METPQELVSSILDAGKTASVKKISMNFEFGGNPENFKPGPNATREELEYFVEEQSEEIANLVTENERLEHELGEKSQHSGFVEKMKLLIKKQLHSGEGWLYKLSFKGKFGKNWRLRYFRVNLPTRTLCYFKDPQDKSPIKSVKVPRDFSCEKVDVEKYHGRKFVFRLLATTEDNQPWEFFFSAGSEVERQRWEDYWNRVDPAAQALEASREEERVKQDKFAGLQKRRLQGGFSKFGQKKKKKPLLKQLLAGEGLRGFTSAARVTQEVGEMFNPESSFQTKKQKEQVDEVQQRLDDIEYEIEMKKQLLLKKREEKKKAAEDMASDMGWQDPMLFNAPPAALGHGHGKGENSSRSVNGGGNEEATEQNVQQ